MKLILCFLLLCLPWSAHAARPDPHEQRELATDPRHTKTLATLRAELDAWMKTRGDQQTVLAAPRLLSDPSSYGPSAEITSRGKPLPKPKSTN